MAAGAAIVATDVGGTASVVAQRLATEVLTLLDDPDRLETLREAARARAKTLPTRGSAARAALTSYRRAAAYRSQPHVD